MRLAHKVPSSRGMSAAPLLAAAAALKYVGAGVLEALLMGAWGALGASSSFRPGWALAGAITWHRHHRSPSSQEVLCVPSTTLGWSQWGPHAQGDWGLLHGIPGSSSISSLGIHACSDCVLMHKTGPSSTNYLGTHARSA